MICFWYANGKKQHTISNIVSNISDANCKRQFKRETERE